jgi:hypothetical protein
MKMEAKKKFDLRPVEQMPQPDHIDNEFANEIVNEWTKIYGKFQENVERLIENAVGKEKFAVKIIGENALRHIVVKFI